MSTYSPIEIPMEVAVDTEEIDMEVSAGVSVYIANAMLVGEYSGGTLELQVIGDEHNILQSSYDSGTLTLAV